MANSDGRWMMQRAAGVLALESAALAGEQRRARGRARFALEHRFRVTKALAGYLSFKVLDAYLGGRVPGREPEAGEIGDEATLAVRRRLQAEGEQWRQETNPDRREFRRAAFGASKARAREAISSEVAVAASSALAEATAVGVVARCGCSGMELTVAPGVATLADIGTGARRIATLSGAAPTRRSVTDSPP
jgi:hypothetical protein